jgi:hypothetical protein
MGSVTQVENRLLWRVVVVAEAAKSHWLGFSLPPGYSI